MTSASPDRRGGPLSRVRAFGRTVRGRTTVTALLVFAVAIAVSAVALVTVLRELLTDEVVKSARLEAAEISVAIAAIGRLPESLPVADPDDEFAQLLDDAGNVLLASENVTGQRALGPAGSHPVTIEGPLPERPLVLVSTTATITAGGAPRPVTVLVGHSLDAVEDITQTLATLLAVGGPALLVLIGIATWTFIGRALAPVEAIRAEVDVISSRQLDHRVPEPPGQDEVARLARTMNNMLERLERAARRQQRFVADASHELRSPVAAIRQHVEVALSQPAPSQPAPSQPAPSQPAPAEPRGEGTPLAETVLDETLRIQQLLEDLLLLAKADEHTMALRTDAVDLDDLLFEEAARLRTSTDLRVDTGAVSAGQVDGDPTALRRLLRNLVDNAARHAVGRVALGLVENADGVLLSVEDDGPGIPEAERDRVLERFVRLDESRARDDGGSGLGLAIVAELVSAHDATMRIADGSLGGARFELTFPAPAPA